MSCVHKSIPIRKDIWGFSFHLPRSPILVSPLVQRWAEKAQTLRLNTTLTTIKSGSLTNTYF